jgi:hypothetical protein
MAVRIYISFFVVIFLAFYRCVSTRETKMLKKMENKIPSTSRWLGGKDGGVWVNITMLPQNTFEIFVYNDFTGNKVTELTFSYTCQNINENLIVSALSGFGNGLIWHSDSPITKCIKLIEKAP